MKKFWKILVASVLSFTMLFGLTACGGGDDIIVQTNAYFAPFEYYQGDEIVGVDVDIMKKVGEKAGKNVKFVDGDFALVIPTVSEGKLADVGAAGLTITEKRQEKVDFSIPYYTSVQYVIYKTGDNDFTSSTATDGKQVIYWSDLAGMKIGVQRDTTGDIYTNLEIDGDHGNEDPADDYTGVLENTNTTCTSYDSAQIAANAIGSLLDCVIVDELPAQYICKNAQYKCLPLYYKGENGEEDSATEEQYAICVTKGNKELLNIINEVLTDMLKNKNEAGQNEIEQLVAKHLGVED